jgi:hypothetical protein
MCLPYKPIFKNSEKNKSSFLQDLAEKIECSIHAGLLIFISGPAGGSPEIDKKVVNRRF